MPRNKVSAFDMKVRSSISQNLRRLTANITQGRLSEMTGIPQSTLSGYFAERSTPNPEQVQKIADALGVDKAAIDPRFSDRSDLLHPHMKRVPMLGYAAAGRPLEDVNQSVAYYDVDDKYDVDFCITVRGDSMIDAGINDGDIVFIRAMSEVPNGKIACIRIDGDRACLKRFYRTGDTVTLVSANSAYAPMVFTKENCESLEVVGLAVIKQSEIK